MYKKKLNVDCLPEFVLAKCRPTQLNHLVCQHGRNGFTVQRVEAVGEGLYFETWRRVKVPVETGESDDTLLFNRAKLGLCDRAHNKGSLHGFHNPRSLP